MAHSCPGRVRRHVRSWRKPTPHSRRIRWSTDRHLAALAYIYQIAGQLNAAWSADDKKDRKLDAWKVQKAIEALRKIAELADRQMVELVGNEKAMDDIGIMMEGDRQFEEYSKQFAPYPE